MWLRLGRNFPQRFSLARGKDRQLVCQRIMAFLLRQTGIALGIGLLIFCSSCEKHPLGEMPEVQREQVDPAKAWSEASGRDSEKSLSSPTPAEFFPAKTRP
jgi:hypothetical protein